MTFYTHPSMEIAGLLPEAIIKHRNTMPQPHTPGAPIFRGPDVTAFLHKYESLALFTGTDPSNKDVISMFPYYCAEGLDVRETVMMMRGYTDRDWAALKKEMLDAFRYTDSRPDSLVYTRQYLEQLCASFGGREDTESLKWFLRTFDHISRVVTERRMMCEYERTEMLLRALPKRLWVKGVTKLGMHPLEPSTFDYCKLKNWIDARCSTAEALAMCEFLASPNSTVTTPSELTNPPTSTAHSPSPTFPAPMASATPIASSFPGADTDTTPATPTAPKATAAPMTPTPSGTASPMTLTVPPAPMISTTAHKSPTATDIALITSMAPTTSPALPCSAPTISPASPISLALVPLITSGTPTSSPAPTASTAFTPPVATTPAAGQGTIRAEPFTVRLGIIRVEPSRGQQVRQHRYVQPDHCQKPAKPHGTESTATSQSEPASPNRQEPVQLPRSEPIVPSHNEPAPSNCPKPGRPLREPEAMQPHSQEPAPPNRQEPIKLPRSKPIVPSHNQPVPPCRQEIVQPPPCLEPVQPPQQDVPPCHYCANNEHNLRNCVELRMDLKKGIVSINNRDRLVLGTAGAEIPMEPAARDFRTIRDYVQAGAPILTPSPAPRARSPPPPPPPPVQSTPPSRTSTPLLSPEQLTQLMREVTEHFAQSRQYEVDVPPPPPQPAQLSRTSVPLPSPDQLTQLVREVTGHFAQPRPKQTTRPPPAVRKARMLEQR